jgi:hypothetical protein
MVFLEDRPKTGVRELHLFNVTEGCIAPFKPGASIAHQNGDKDLFPANDTKKRENRVP